MSTTRQPHGPGVVRFGDRCSGEERMRFDILGPLRITLRDGAEAVVRSRHERTLLAVLLMRAGRAVPVADLAEALWPARPPASHLSNLHTYLSRLRTRLPALTIEQVNGGYRVDVGAADLDLLRFTGQITAGRAALAGDRPAEAVQRFRTALALWRGRPLADLSVTALEPEIAQLEIQRLGAVEDCVDAALAVADERDLSQVLAELHRLVAEHPLRERLRGQLMAALSLAGRRADALTAYQAARTTLVEELGIEPGPALQRLHLALLRGDDVRLALGMRPAAAVEAGLTPD